MSIINVSFKVYGSTWHIRRVLQELSSRPVLSFDTEVRGVYSKAEREEAIQYLKGEDLPLSSKRIALQIADNSGLSFPSLVNVTHFIFGLSDHESIILLCDNHRTEMLIWEWLAQHEGLLLIHNTLYDLKIMYHRVRKLPKNYEDTQILAKCLINNVEKWKGKVGLKDLMGSHYDPMWVLMEDYEPANPKEPKFLKYCSIDGAATFKLWYDIQDHIGEACEQSA